MDCLFQTVFLSKSLFLGCGGLTLAHIKAASSLPFPAGQGDTRQPLLSWAEQVWFGEIIWIYCKSNQNRIMRSKPKSLKHISLTPPFQAQIYPQFSLPPPLRGRRLYSVHHMLSNCSFLLRVKTPLTPPLLQHTVPPMEGSLPWVFPMACSSSQIAPARIPSMQCNPSGTGCSSVDSLWDPKSCQQNLLQHGLFSPQGHRSLLKAHSNIGFPQGHSLLWASTCCGMRSFRGCNGHLLPNGHLLHYGPSWATGSVAST